MAASRIRMTCHYIPPSWAWVLRFPQTSRKSQAAHHLSNGLREFHLAEAGGPSKDAYQEKIVVVNLSCCSNEARVFNLVEFARTGNYAMLPLVRQGDTVYVPDTTQSDWRVFFDGVRDAVSVLTIFGLLKVLGL